jgi:hypothetical protein
MDYNVCMNNCFPMEFDAIYKRSSVRESLAEMKEYKYDAGKVPNPGNAAFFYEIADSEGH